MSRIGRTPIPIPSGVELSVDANKVTVKGPRGQLSREIHPDMELVRENGTLERAKNEARRYAGLALDALGELEDTPYRRALCSIPNFIVERET